VRCRSADTKTNQIDLATVQITYRDEDLGIERELQLQARVEVTEDGLASEQSLNVSVSKQVALTRNAEVREKALTLADQGKAKEAAGLLKQQAAANAALPAALRDERLDKDNRFLSSTASVLETEGSLDKSERKAFQYENYRQKKQKN
jgi:hypothetical protein